MVVGLFIENWDQLLGLKIDPLHKILCKLYSPPKYQHGKSLSKHKPVLRSFPDHSSAVCYEWPPGTSTIRTTISILAKEVRRSILGTNFRTTSTLNGSTTS